MHGIDGHRLHIATSTKSLVELFPFEEGCGVGFFSEHIHVFFLYCVYPFWSWIASSTIDDHLFLTSRFTALYYWLSVS